MNGSKDYILSFIKSSRELDIPYYQRNYDWKLENCQRLMEDLYKMIENDYNSHFFGSIVVKPGVKHSSAIIIDGQQRITTISLLALAIYNYIMENEIETYANPNSWYSDYLVDQRFKGKSERKLNSNPRDNIAYKALYSTDNSFIKASNITKNYEYFYKEVSSGLVDLDSLMEAIERLEIIVINLDSPNDDAQLIFESLNSTGLDLKESDKIRNFLLMNEDILEQNYLFENYWQRIEDFTELSLDEFTRFYLTMKNYKYPNKNKIYEEFKSFYNKNYESKKREFFAEFLNYSKVYFYINNWSTGVDKVDTYLKRFIKLDVSVLKPFLLSVINDMLKSIISEEETSKILSIIESYISRRSITKQSSNALNKVFSTLYRDLKKYLDSNINNNTESEIIAYILMSKPGSARFPYDDLVSQSLRQGDFYNINSKFRTYLFERLENKDTIEAIDIYKGIEDDKFSIEHIMPQKLNSNWKTMLGENYKEVHETYLNSIGNLTLTGYNSKYSNKSFEEKKNMEDGFTDSKFLFLNKLPSTKLKWTEQEIKERTNLIIARALETWNLPKTTFEPTVASGDLIPFTGDDFSQFTGYYLKGYTFLDDNYVEQNTWINLYFDVIKALYKLDPNIIIEEANQGFKSVKNYISNEKYESRTSKKLDDGIFILTDISNWDKLNSLNYLFGKYEIEPENLMVDIYKKKISI